MAGLKPASRFPFVFVATGVSVLVYAFGLAVLGLLGSSDAGDTEFARVPLVVSSIIVGLVYVAGLWCSRKHAIVARHELGAILLVGLAARCVVLVSPPFLEDDYHRYLLDGAVTAHGVNPYGVVPEQLLVDDPSSPGGPLGDFQKPPQATIATTGRETIEQVNHPHLATIYPPVAQAVFAAAHVVKPWSVYALRFVLLAFDIATVVLLVVLLADLKLPPIWVAWYWWNPVLLREVTSSAHMDVVAFPSVVAGVLFALRRRTTWCSLALVGAVGAKLWPVLLAPVLLRTCARRISVLLWGSVMIVGGSALMLWPMLLGATGDDAGLHAFSRYWRNNEGFFAIWSYVASVVLSPFSINGDDVIRYSRVAVAIVVGGWAALCALKPIRDGRDLTSRILSVIAVLFLLGPTQFPWYYLWMLPLLCVRNNFALLLYTATLPLYYLHYEYRFVLWIEHFPVWVALLAFWVFGKKHKRESANPRAT